MRRLPNVLSLLTIAAFAAACDDPAPRSYAPATGPGTTPANPVAPSASTKSAEPATKRVPQMPPLTEETAKAVLAAQVASLGGDDESRQALLYLADLGDKTCLAAVRERLLARDATGYIDPSAAAVGAEALLAFGENDGASTALAAAKQYAAEETDADEYLLHALARVTGAERAEALKALLAAAAGDDADMAPLAVQLLAASGAAEARETFVRLARDTQQEPQVRGAAVAGLLRMKDPGAALLADGLVAAATSGKAEDQIDTQELLLGFAVDGAVEVSPYVRKLVDAALVENDASAQFVMDELPPTLAAIHRAGGGAELVPWLREIAKKHAGEIDPVTGKQRPGEYDDVTALAQWLLGDDTQAAEVADQLEGMVVKWTGIADLSSAVAILDAAARRGVAAKEPFRRLVDSSAQIQPPAGAAGANGYVRALNLAAAHAFLKSSK